MSNARPRVTVIVPTYNRAPLLGEALRSVLDQTFADFEVIVVDDGSTDEIRTVLERFDDPRVRYLYQENRGISGAMNTGLRAARGELVARLDSDDVWLPEMLAVQVAALDANPDAGLVYSQAQGMDCDGRLSYVVLGQPLPYPDDTFCSMLCHDVTCNITVVARRACFDRAGWYDETLPIHEDWDMWLRIARHARFVYVGQVLAWFRNHPGNTTGRDSPIMLANLEKRSQILDKMFCQPDLPRSAQAIKPLAYQNAYLWIGRRWLVWGYYRKAARSFWAALRAGRNPPRSLARVLWISLVDLYLLRSPWGRSLAMRLAEVARRITGLPQIGG